MLFERRGPVRCCLRGEARSGAAFGASEALFGGVSGARPDPVLLKGRGPIGVVSGARRGLVLRKGRGPVCCCFMRGEVL